MKRVLRFTVLFLLLCIAFQRSAQISTLSPSVSLRFDSLFSMEQAESFAAVWAEEQAVVSGFETTLIRFGGDAQLAFPAVWLYDTPPNDLMENACAVSTRLAWEIYGGADVTGLTAEIGAETYTICGVFDHAEAVLLLPDDGRFTAAELFPVPDDTDPYRYARDCAAQAGLEEPSQILCGPEAACVALLFPWLCVLLAIWPLLRRMTRGHNWLWVFVLLIPLTAVPDWFIPTRWSDTVFWAELGQSLSSRFRDWLTLSPSLRDLPIKQGWFLLGMVTFFSCVLSMDKRGSR